ncbi:MULTISPECIES: hypothetical protein [unclassified Modestobacter]
MENSWRSETDPEAARRALAVADGASAAGARRAVRPWWYHPALGGCLALVFASFSFDLSTPVVAAFVVLVVAISAGARSATGAAPHRSYLSRATRGPSVAFVVLTVALFAVGLVLERAADLTGAMVVCGLAVLVLTVITGRRVDRASAEQRASRDHG